MAGKPRNLTSSRGDLVLVTCNADTGQGAAPPQFDASLNVTGMGMLCHFGLAAVRGGSYPSNPLFQLDLVHRGDHHHCAEEVWRFGCGLFIGNNYYCRGGSVQP